MTKGLLILEVTAGQLIHVNGGITYIVVTGPCVLAIKCSH